MNMNKKSLCSSKVYVVAIILFIPFLVLCLLYIVTGQPPITFINAKPYYTYTKNLRIQGGELSPELEIFRYLEYFSQRLFYAVIKSCCAPLSLTYNYSSCLSQN